MTPDEACRVDVTHVAAGGLEEMASSTAAPSPELRAAMDRAKERRAGRLETCGAEFAFFLHVVTTCGRPKGHAGPHHPTAVHTDPEVTE